MKYLLLLLTFSIQAKAGVVFQCFSEPAMPTIIYDYGTSNCSTTKRPAFAKRAEFESLTSASAKLKGLGEPIFKDALCMYQAVCKPPDTSKKKSSKQVPSVDEIRQQVQNYELKNSLLVCNGVSASIDNKRIDALCPPVEECLVDAFYDYTPLMPMPDQPIQSVLFPEGNQK